MEVTDLEKTALRVREHVLRMAVGGGCFAGSALSCADLMVYLYCQFLNLNGQNLDDPSRDYFLLSKGHAVPALYGTLVQVGLLAPERLENHLQIEDAIYWHPNPTIPGVEFHFGSLGHGLPVAVGVALDCKIGRGTNRVVVMTGDGELNEGSNWEALLIASAYGLDNLVIVVDRNRFQANIRTEELIPLEPVEAKFEAFGCRAMRVNGHDFAALAETFGQLPLAPGKPSVIIAETIRGRGVPSIQERADRWFVKLDPDEAEMLVDELLLSAGQDRSEL